MNGSLSHASPHTDRVLARQRRTSATVYPGTALVITFFGLVDIQSLRSGAKCLGLPAFLNDFFDSWNPHSPKRPMDKR